MMRIKNWERFQHYRNRRPPWIKLYRDILDDYEFQRLSDTAVRVLVCLWLMASESDEQGTIPDDADVIAWRLRMPPKKVSAAIEELQDAGFLEKMQQASNQRASTALASCKQVATPETETETETEYITPPYSPPPTGGDLHGSAPVQAQTPKPKPKPKGTNGRKVPQPPGSLDEVIAYAKERGAPESLARKFWDYFQEGGWRDSQGKPVLRWKQKFITWQDQAERRGYGGGNSRHAEPVFGPPRILNANGPLRDDP